MSEFRRRLMMSQSGEEPIDWDYEWYPPEEKPTWLSIDSNVSPEMFDNYYRIHARTSPGTPNNRLMFHFDSTFFPNTNSYIMDIDMYEMINPLGTSYQAGLAFSATSLTNGTISDGLWLARTNKKNSETGYNKPGLSTSYYGSSSAATNATACSDVPRYVLRLNFDNQNELFIASVNSFSVQRSVSDGAPRGVFNRYSNNGYIDVYSIKIKVI